MSVLLLAYMKHFSGQRKNPESADGGVTQGLIACQKQCAEILQWIVFYITQRVR